MNSSSILKVVGKRREDGLPPYYDKLLAWHPASFDSDTGEIMSKITPKFNITLRETSVGEIDKLKTGYAVDSNGTYIKDGTWFTGYTPSFSQVETEVEFGLRESFGSCHHKGFYYVIGGYTGTVKNDVWKSSDCETWELVTANGEFSARQIFAVYSLGDYMYLFFGIDGSANKLKDVWRSTDGSVWEECVSDLFPGAPIAEVMTYKFNNKLFVAGGYNLDTFEAYATIKSSTDGINWNLETSTAEFEGRSSGYIVNFNNKLFLYDSWNAIEFVPNEIWSSTNGVNWVLETNTLNISKTGYLSAGFCVYYDKLWKIGGLTETGSVKTGYFSDNGLSWTQAYADSGHPIISNYGIAVFDSSIKIFGGYASGSTRYDNVWSYTLENYDAFTGSININGVSNLGVIFDFGNSTEIESAGMNWTSWDGEDWKSETIDEADTKLSVTYENALSVNSMNSEAIQFYSGTSNVSYRMFFKITNAIYATDGSGLINSGMITDILIYKEDLSLAEVLVVLGWCGALPPSTFSFVQDDSGNIVVDDDEQNFIIGE